MRCRYLVFSATDFTQCINKKISINMFLCGYFLNSLRCVGSVAVTGESGFVPKPLLQSERDVDVVRIRCHRSLVSRWNKNPDVAALAPALGRGQVPIGYSFSSRQSSADWTDGSSLPSPVSFLSLRGTDSMRAACGARDAARRG